MFSPFTPRFPAYAGPHEVGSVDVEIPVSELDSSSDVPFKTIAFRMFYPCEKPTKPQKPVRWISDPQRSIVAAYARFLGASSSSSDFFALISQLLYSINIPVHRDALPLPSPHGSKRWPLMIFSHGLGGSRNAYSHFCGTMASYGMIVVAPDHRDGSSPISHIRAVEGAKASTVDYIFASHDPTEETYDCRDQQLRIRLSELSLLHKALNLIDAGSAIKNLNLSTKVSLQGKKAEAPQSSLEMFKESMEMHKPGSIIWAGHSFGAATTVQFIKSVYYSERQKLQTCIFSNPPSTKLAEQITESSPSILLDPWGLPLNSPSTSKLSRLPMPCFSSSSSLGGDNILAILSEAFVKWKTNFQQIKRALSDPLGATSASSTEKRSVRPTARIFYPLRSAHLSQSDFGILFPRLTKYFAKAEEPERTLKLNIRAALQCLREAGVPVARTSPADMEDLPTVVVKAKKWKDDNVGQLLAAAENGADRRILCTEADSVQGWIAVRAEDYGDEDSTKTSEASPQQAALSASEALIPKNSGNKDHDDLVLSDTVSAGDPVAENKKSKGVRGTLRRTLTGPGAVVVNGGKN